MERQRRKSPLLGVGLIVTGLIALILWGCGGSGGTSSSASGTTVRVVFPQQSAMVLEESLSEPAARQPAIPLRSLMGVISELIRFAEISTAHAQVIPSNVARILLIITGPGILDPIQRDIDPATGRVTVDVPVGNDRVFEVQAFPTGLPIANFIGRVRADVPPRGTNVTVNMQAVTLNAIQVTPTNPQLAKGTIQRFTATGAFSDGTVQNLTPLVNWASSDTSVAVISNAEGIEGLATGVQEGTTQITATLMNVTGATIMTVTAAEVVAIAVTPAMPSIAVGTRLQFVATGLFTDGTSQDLTPSASWASSTVNPAVASISATGLATALAVGTTIISATFQDVTGETLLTVTPAELAAITVTPAMPSIAVGTRLQFTATGLFSDGSSQDLTNTATWTSSDTSICTVAPTGLAIGLAVGACTISAGFQGLSGGTVLSVTAAQFVALVVAPANATIGVGTAVQFTATGIRDDGTRQDLTADATWASSNTAVAAISNATGSRGVATGVAAGTSTISAGFQGLSGGTVLSVTAAQFVALVVAPANATIGVGTTVQFTATGLFSDGTSQNLTNTATWTSSDIGVCTVAPTGRATGVAPGTCTIMASFQGISGSTILGVTAATLVDIIVTPVNPTIGVGTTVQFTATGLFSDGSSQDLTSSATWTSSAPNVCAIGALGPTTGLATGLAVGTCTISAGFQGLSGGTVLSVTAAQLVQLTVTPVNPTIGVGTTLQFIVTGIFSDGTVQTLTTNATWQSSNPAVASISNAPPSQGLATAIAPGTTSISATFQGLSGSVTLTVSTAALATITVTPANPTVGVGTTLQFQATGIFDDGTGQDLTGTATWTSSVPAVSAVSPTGLATALTPGSAIIGATFGGITGTTSLTVTPAELAAIIVTPSDSIIGVGTTLQFTATGVFTDGTSQNVTADVTWASSASNIATISPQGVATAITPGSTTISATFQGLAGTATLTITPALLADVIVTPVNPTIGVGTTLQFTATGVFSDGLNQDLTADVTWQSSNADVATISNAEESEGLASGVAPGSTAISATFQGLTDSTLLTVNPAVLEQIIVTPVNPTFTYFFPETLQFTATGVFSDGLVQDLTDTVAWDSTDQEVATIGPDGVATILGSGATTISATLNGVVGVSILTITDNYASSLGTTKIAMRFMGIIGTATLTVMLMGLIFRGGRGQRPDRGPRRRG